MRGLATCLVVGAIGIAGCGSDDSAQAPSVQQAASSKGTASSVAVSAQARASIASLCAPEGKGKPKHQCTTALKRLDKGRVTSPTKACKGISKKKTKGVRGKSPFAVCVTAAAKLKASKHQAGNGSADSSGGSDDAQPDDSGADDSADDSGSDDSADDGAGQDDASPSDKADDKKAESDDPPADTEPDDPAEDDSGD